MRTVVYEYGLRQPEYEQPVDNQIWLAHQYYNTLVEIERAHRTAIMEAQAEFGEIADAKEQLERAYELKKNLAKKIKASRSYGSTVIPPTKKDLEKAKYDIAEAKENLKEAKAHEKEKLEPIYKRLQDERKAALKKAYNEASEIYWGTKLVTSAAFDAACKKKLRPSKKPIPYEKQPAFRKWPPGQPPKAQIAVQIQKGMSADSVFGDGRLVQVDPLDRDAFDTSFPRGYRRKKQYTTLRLRIGSDGRTPIWASWPMYMHRPFPDGAVVKWVRVVREPLKQRWEFKWYVQFTLEVPEKIQKQNGPAVAVNLGWRKMEGDEMRVATWVDSDGEKGEIRLGWSFAGRMEKARHIRSIRDRNLDALKADLDDTRFDKWKSHERFHQFLKMEKLLDEQTLTPEQLDELSDWAYRDRHLWWYERGLRNGALNYRREQYRLLAKELAQSYRYIIVEDYDLRDIAEDPKRAQEPSRQRVEGSPSQARFAIKSAAEREGAIVIAGESKMVTQICNKCYCKEPWDAAKSVMHICKCCGCEFDQDVNNASNLLEWGLEGIKKGELPVVKVRRAARFAKRHKK